MTFDQCYIMPCNMQPNRLWQRCILLVSLPRGTLSDPLSHLKCFSTWVEIPFQTVCTGQARPLSYIAFINSKLTPLAQVLLDKQYSVLVLP